MKLTDENGEKWVALNLNECIDRMATGSPTDVILIRKVQKPANPMPVPVNGQIVEKK